MSEKTGKQEPSKRDAGEMPEIVTPAEHSTATEDLEVGTDVASADVAEDIEIAARSADMEEPSLTHVKVFVLGAAPGGGSANPYTEAKGFDHEPNKLATVQYAIDSGLRPTGEVTFKSAKRHPDGASWVLTYEVPVTVAHRDEALEELAN